MAMLATNLLTVALSAVVSLLKAPLPNLEEEAKKAEASGSPLYTGSGFRNYEIGCNSPEASPKELLWRARIAALEWLSALAREAQRRSVVPGM